MDLQHHAEQPNRLRGTIVAFYAQHCEYRLVGQPGRRIVSSRGEHRVVWDEHAGRLPCFQHHCVSAVFLSRGQTVRIPQQGLGPDSFGLVAGVYFSVSLRKIFYKSMALTFVNRDFIHNGVSSISPLFFTSFSVMTHLYVSKVRTRLWCARPVSSTDFTDVGLYI